MSDHNLTTVKFASLDLEPALLQGIAEAGFERCTPIQAAALPKALTGHDVQGQAQTGTGKTAAFLLATMNRLLRTAPADGYQPGQPRALIVAPTRELAVQIHKDAEVLGRHTGLRMGVVFGGTGYDTQREMLRAGLDILIGTPGRLIDYFKQHVFSLSYIDVVVMDEADRMFDLGFIKDVRYLMRRMPPATRRLNMLFSATLSLRVQELAYEHMNAPEMIDASPTDEVTVSRVTQVLYHVSKDEKIPLLLGLLGKGDATRTMVFVNTRRGAERVSNYLEGNGYPCAVLTGDVPQKTRLALLERFTRGEVPVLVATDVAARGLHIPEVTHVVNFDLPQDPEDYVHRVGRTARAGASGDAVSFACEEYVFGLEEIESFIGQRIPVLQVRDEDLVTPAPPARSRHTRPRDGRRDGRPEGGRGRSRGSDRDRGRDGRGPRPPRRETAPASTPSEAVQEPAVEPAPAPDASPAAEAKPPRRRRTRSRRGAEAGEAAEATAVESASPPGETPAVAEPAAASEPSAEDASPRPRRRRTRTRRATASETGDDQAATAETSPATDAEVEAGTPATPDGAASSEARPRRRRRRRTRSGSDSGADVAPATPDAAD